MKNRNNVLVASLVGMVALVLDVLVLSSAFSNEGVKEHDWIRAVMSILGQLVLLAGLWHGWGLWTRLRAGRSPRPLAGIKLSIMLGLVGVVLFGLSLSTLYISIACPGSPLPTVRGHKLCERND